METLCAELVEAGTSPFETSSEGWKLLKLVSSAQEAGFTFETSSEGWKRNVGGENGSEQYSFETSSEGWKLAWECHRYLRKALSKLPLRDGNVNIGQNDSVLISFFRNFL